MKKRFLKILVLVFIFISLSGLYKNFNVANAQTNPLGNVASQVGNEVGASAAGASEEDKNTVEKGSGTSVDTDDDSTNDPDDLAELIIYGFGNLATFIFVSIGSLWIWIAATIFDTALTLTVVEVGSQFTKDAFLTTVETLWKIFRDFGNLIIIFSLLFLAIKTILKGDGFADKKILGGILIAAIFINFSLFFTKLVFDISNVASISIINNIGSTDDQGLALSSRITKNFKYTTVVNTSYNNTKTEGFYSRMTTQVVQSLFALVLLLLTGCIFIAACLFLVVRFLIFLLLMIVSPIGFIGKFIPLIDQQTKKWWDQLWKQAIALPVFVLMLYVAFLFIDKTGTSNKIDLDWSEIFSGKSAKAVGETVSSTFSSVFYFIISLGLLIASIIVPGMIGGAGSKLIASGTGRVGAFMGRRTFDAGRLGGNATGWGLRKAGVDTDKLKSKASRLTRLSMKDGKTWKGKVAKGAAGFLARKTVDTREALKDKTFDFRNISIAGRTIGERYGLGKGANSYRKILEDKEKDVAAKLKRDEERYNLGERTPEEKAQATIEQATLQDKIKSYSEQNSEKAKEYNQAKKEGKDEYARQLLKDYAENQKIIAETQSQLNKSKNPGMFTAHDINNSGLNRLINVMTGQFEKNRALTTAISKQEKQWNKSGDQKLMADLKKALSGDKDKDKEKK